MATVFYTSGAPTNKMVEVTVAGIHKVCNHKCTSEILDKRIGARADSNNHDLEAIELAEIISSVARF